MVQRNNDNALNGTGHIDYIEDVLVGNNSIQAQLLLTIYSLALSMTLLDTYLLYVY
jgi:hypothetical protein